MSDQNNPGGNGSDAPRLDRRDFMIASVATVGASVALVANTTSANAQVQSCYAACDSGNHPPFLGPTRSSRSEAQSDADLHNTTCNTQGATVVCS
jgi:hypothetical protein